MTDNNLYTVIPYKNKLLRFHKPVTAFLYYKNKSINLVTGEEKKVEIGEWLGTLQFPVIKHAEDKRFIHLFYECGFIFEKLYDKISDDELLAIDVTYSLVEDYFLDSLDSRVNPYKLSPKKYPEYSQYKEKFKLGYEELKKGNCYQFNLTEEFIYLFDEKLIASEIISKIWGEPRKRGAYASATFVGAIDKLFLSNSPECLFQYESGELTTRPVKGTMKRQTESLKEVKSLWNQLVKDEKSQAELFMITDLLRNDLCRIDLPVAFVTKMKAPLLAPGIIHQYSEIKIKLRSHVTLRDIISKMFPGGSITGAPKNKVMKILHSLEKRTRGFYCGSTILLVPGEAISSINIRSGVFDFKDNSLSYQAGGGITLLSTAENEFQELLLKHDSFLTLLTL